MASPLSLQQLRSHLRTQTMGRKVIYRSSLPSTMDLARHEADAGAAEGTVVAADAQTAGRGRLGRTWISPPGANVYVSVVLRPEAQHLRALSMVCPLAVCRAIEEVTGLPARIKWPNDVLIHGRKVSGTLIDAEFEDGGVRFAIAGVGINVNFDASRYEEIRDLATSLSTELGREVSREKVLAAFLNYLEELYLGLRLGQPVRGLWKARLDTLGQRVRVRSGVPGMEGEEHEGLAEDADESGALILRRADGSTVRIEAGDVTLKA